MNKIATTSNPRHRRFLAELDKILKRANVSRNNVTIGAGGYLGAMGIKESNDLDVWVDRQAFSRLSNAGGRSGVAGSGTPKIDFRTPMGEIECFTGPWITKGVDYAGHRDTVVFDGFRHWSQAKTIRWKRAMGRDKDRADLKRMMNKTAAFEIGFIEGLSALKNP